MENFVNHSLEEDEQQMQFLSAIHEALVHIFAKAFDSVNHPLLWEKV